MQQQIYDRSLNEMLGRNIITNPQDPVIETTVKDIDPEKAYFLTITCSRKVPELAPYFHPSLQELYNREIEHIAIVPFRPPSEYNGQYVLLNDALKKRMYNGTSNEYGLLGMRSKDMEEQVSSSAYVHELVECILEQQPDVHVNSLTNWGHLDICNNNKVKVLAPPPKCVNYFNDKINQRKVFETLDLPVPEGFIVDSIDELADVYQTNFKRDAFITCSHGSAGSGCEIIHSQEDIFSSPKIGTFNPERYLISEYLDVMFTPSTFAIIADDDIYILPNITDQIMENGIHFRGAISPSMANSEQREKMVSITETIGGYMKDKGYHGPFGVDFMFDRDGKIYVGEINARNVGSTSMLTKAHALANPHAPTISGMVFNSVTEGTLGVDSKSYKPSEISWGYIVKEGKAGQRTRAIIGPNPPYITILDHPGEDVPLYTDANIARIVYIANPKATREQILSALDERAKDITLY